MQTISIISELFKNIAWPIAAFFIALLFKSEVQILLPRLRRAGLSGVEFDAFAQQKQKAEESHPFVPNELMPIPGIGRTKAIEEVERLINSTLLSIQENEKVARLVNALAVARLSSFFERIYNLIFGSQIRLLKILNGINQSSIDEARSFFQHFKDSFPEVYEKYGFDGWFGFLENQELIHKNGDTIIISEVGRDFLLYLTTQRLSEDKMF